MMMIRAALALAVCLMLLLVSGVQAADSSAAPLHTTVARRKMSMMQLATGNCGASVGACGVGCCSLYNYCGTSATHCDPATCHKEFSAPGFCGQPAPPIHVITQCTVPNTVAFTFDDGPSIYSLDIANQFKAAGGRVTFFWNGHNSSCIYSEVARTALKTVLADGHQVASHTWSHPHLPALSDEEIGAQMDKLSTAFKRIVGYAPRYMRPPFGDHNLRVDTKLASMGFNMVAMWSIDSGDTMHRSMDEQKAAHTNSALGPQLPLAHDIKPDTASTLVPFLIEWAKSRGYKMVTVGECIDDPKQNWYTPIGQPEEYDPKTWWCVPPPSPPADGGHTEPATQPSGDQHLASTGAGSHPDQTTTTPPPTGARDDSSSLTGPNDGLALKHSAAAHASVQLGALMPCAILSLSFALLAHF